MVRAVLGERVTEHGQATNGLLTGNLILDDVPVVFEYPVFHAHGVHHDPRYWQAVAAEPTPDKDHVALGHDQLQLVGQRVWERLGQPEETFAAGWDVRTVLDVILRPKALGGALVALVEEGVERFAHDRLVEVGLIECQGKSS
jgi:hypothetical protein